MTSGIPSAFPRACPFNSRSFFGIYRGVVPSRDGVFEFPPVDRRHRDVATGRGLVNVLEEGESSAISPDGRVVASIAGKMMPVRMADPSEASAGRRRVAVKESIPEYGFPTADSSKEPGSKGWLLRSQQSGILTPILSQTLGQRAAQGRFATRGADALAAASGVTYAGVDPG